MRASRFLRAACLLLIGALAATLWWGHLFLEHARQDAIRAVDEFNAETEQMMTVYDSPIPDVSNSYQSEGADMEEIRTYFDERVEAEDEPTDASMGDLVEDEEVDE